MEQGLDCQNRSKIQSLDKYIFIKNRKGMRPEGKDLKTCGLKIRSENKRFKDLGLDKKINNKRNPHCI